MTDTLYDLAEKVIASDPTATKAEWGKSLLALTEGASGDLAAEVHSKLLGALGHYVSGIKSAQEKRRQKQRLMDMGIAYNGRLINPMLSITTEDGDPQYALWLEATPRQFIDAVLKEQNVVDGRNTSNQVRMQVVKMLQEDESLMDMASLRDVCDQLGVDTDTLALEELA